MTTMGPKTDFLVFPWDFYERAIRNYSVIMRMIDSLEQSEGFLKEIPRIFVEHTGFEICKIYIMEEDSVREESFTFDVSPDGLTIDHIMKLNAGALSPKAFSDSPGFGTLFVYPLKDGLRMIGFFVLGAKDPMTLDDRLFREFEILCEIFNKSFLFSRRPAVLKNEGPATLHEAVMDVFPHSFLLLDRNGNVCYANNKALAEFQGRKGLLLGEQVRNIFLGMDEVFFEADKPVQGEIGYWTKGVFRLFEIECYPIKYRGGAYKGIILRDIADRRITEERAIQKQTLESIGMVAGGTAHDFNNLLTGILGYASLMTKHLPQGDKLFQYAELIQDSAQRAAELTKHLVNFSRRRKKPTGGINVNALLDDVLYLLKESLIDVTVEKDLDESIPAIRGDESEIQRVFLALCVNAKDMMNGQGVLKISTKRQRGAGKEFAIIEVRNTGKGLDEDNEPSDFADIGLYMIQKIISRYDGLMEVQGKKGQGTIFTVYLPVEAPTPIKPKALVVDVEEIVRGLLKGILDQEGFEVLEAINEDQAVDWYKKYKGEVDLIILDVIRPGTKEDDLLNLVRSGSGRTEVIVSSGFMSEEHKEELRKYGVHGFLDKPYREKDVVEMLAALISGKRTKS